MEYIILELCLIVLGLALVTSILDDEITIIPCLAGDGIIKITINKRTKNITYDVK